MDWVIGGILFFTAVVAALLSQVATRPIVIGSARYSPAPAILVFASIVFMVGLVFFYRGFKTRRIMTQGISARAQIIAVEETSTRVNGQPLCRFRLRVSLPGQMPYEGSATRVLGMGDIHRIAPGSYIQVKVNPNNPSEMVIAE